jgi:hypothetical protein
MWASTKEKQLPTMRFVQVWLEVVAINFSSLLGIRSGRISLLSI